jgi:RimJ/RimL family protein N-acetyltransferase
MTTASLTAYELRVEGHLGDHWSTWLGDLTVTRHDDSTTTLTGAVPDQARLHGVLAGLRDIGATLISLRALEPGVPPVLEQPVRTERLTLRPAAAEDADAIWAYRRQEAVGEWLTELPRDLDAYRRTFRDPARLATTVVVEHDGELIGDFMLRVEDAWAQTEVTQRAHGRQAELGFVLDPAHTGHGYATEAVRGLVAHCFAYLGVHRVVASCFLDNTASWRLMERIGMRREGHAVAESLHRSGRWLDTLSYAVLADEWPGRGARPTEQE